MLRTCRSSRKSLSLQRLGVSIAFALVFATAVTAQDRRDWGNLAQVQPGDKVTLSISNHPPVTGAFQGWAPDKVSVASVSANKQDVLKIELWRKGGGRGKHALIGALIGFGAGFAGGAASGGNCEHQFGPCFSRPALGGAFGTGGAAVGALVGAVLPGHHKELIYAAK